MNNKLKACWACNHILDGTEPKEHLFLNAIGGNRREKGLLCGACQRYFGEGIDVDMANQLNFFANRLNIKRDRGTPQNIIAQIGKTTETYELTPHNEVVFNGRPIIKKIDQDGEKTRYHIKAPSKRIAKQAIKGLARKHANTNLDESIIDTFKYKTEKLDDHMRISANIGGEKFSMAVVKTILNIYFYNGGRREYVLDAISFSLGVTRNKLVNWYLGSQNVIKQFPDEILHAVIIKGDPREKILYAYAEFFTAAQFICSLNTNYNGPEFKMHYLFNPRLRKEVHRTYELDLSSQDLKKLIDKDVYSQDIHKKFEDFIKIAVNTHSTDGMSSSLTTIICDKLSELYLNPLSKLNIAHILEEITEQVLKEIKPRLTDKSDKGISEFKKILFPVIVRSTLIFFKENTGTRDS